MAGGPRAGGHPRPRSVVVIGAGAAGLAVGSELWRRGVDVLALEAAGRPGESWRRRYAGLHLNSVRWMSSLPREMMPRRCGDFPPAEAYAAYLERYAVRHGPPLQLSTRAERIERTDGGWMVRTAGGELEAESVVVATGMDHTPTVPDWPGAPGFAGRIVHSAQVRHAEAFRGKDVLVVGAGNSATELAEKATRAGARQTWIAVRRAPLIFPRRLLGVSITAWALPASALPDRPLDAVSRAVQRLRFGDLSGSGLGRPARGASAQRREGYIAPVDSGFVEAVRSGAVQVVGAVESFERDAAVLAGGRRIRPAVVVAATGYRTGLSELVGHLGVLGEDERPLAHGAAHPPGAPRLYFVGYRRALLPTLPLVGGQARALARRLAAQP
jgi:cation diffusion facilitator CzcD-associated flavoprotein CzcO